VHDKDYRNSQKDFEAFVEKLTEMVIERDDTIPELPMKDLVRLHAFTCLSCIYIAYVVSTP
jgi:hypothetical protein